ncbi:MAG: glycosyltransferase [Myxococcaceae bacterium]|nr:glycosyltransferase [Myxococcaceae bacterium]
MERSAYERRVFFVEEPDFHDGTATLEVTETDQGVIRVVPKLPHGSTDVAAQLKRLIDAMMVGSEIRNYDLWYTGASALEWTRHLTPGVTVYDVHDTPSPGLLAVADVVFTSRHSTYQALRTQHSAVFAFPSSVDVMHFARARPRQPDLACQATIPGPRIGCFGGVDARLDFALLDRVSQLQPRWHIMLVGQVTSWEAFELPRRQNIHWLHGRKYSELPQLIAGWDVGILPYKVDSRTQSLVNPEKAAELLAAGRPVVSTPLPDVLHPYGDLHLVRTAADAESFVAQVKAAMVEERAARLQRCDAFLAAMSWDTTWQRMMNAIADVPSRRMARAA